MMPYNFEKGAIPAPYEAVDWQMRLERIPNDFGQPNKTDPASWASFSDLERSEDFINQTIF